MNDRPNSRRTALVTGAARGIGLACADRLRAAGFRVIGVDLSATNFATGHDDVRDRFDMITACDVASRDSVQTLRAEVGAVDVLVNNAGIVGPSRPLLEVDEAEWRQTLDINLTGMFHTIQAFVPDMVDAGWGRVINLASIAGKEGNPNLAAYSTSKAAVIGLTKSLGKELATTGVLCHSIAPAVIATPINDGTDPAVVEYMVSKIPMGRTGRSEEVAALVAWLASDDCTFSTGACHDISGGRATY